jgi:dTDP-4-dehydrorhamnose reductase
MNNILILGHKGMLGHMVYNTLSKIRDLNISITQQRFPNFTKSTFDKQDFVINCIGAIPQRTNNFKVNYELPTWLVENISCKIIHPGTDCEMDNDDYGLSKKKASDFILDKGQNTKILKSSIIGPELNSNSSLLEWFLSQEKEVFGYTKAIWNGVTTYEWSKQCLELINNWSTYKSLTTLSSDPISKYELLNIIKNVYNKDINIIPKELGKDKTLIGDIKTGNIKKQIIELKSLTQ